MIKKYVLYLQVTLINSEEMNALKNNKNNSKPKKSQLSSEAFPALSASAAPAAPPQWITVSKKAERGRAPRAQPPPPPREPAFDAAADFPTLPLNTKAKPRRPQPTPAPAPAPQPPPPDSGKMSKKDRRKQNHHNNSFNNDDRRDAGPDFSHLNGAIDKKIAREMSYVGIAVSEAPASSVERKVKTVEAVAPERSNGGTGDFSLAERDYPPLGETERRAPPGFRSRPACELTFTNSAGQTFAAPPHAYVPPPEFERRNRALVEKFAVALGGAAAVEDFKAASRAFREGSISADEFYARCRGALGSQLDQVFAELVALLPDIARQQELVVGRAPAALAACAACGQLLAPRDRAAHQQTHLKPPN